MKNKCEALIECPRSISEQAPFFKKLFFFCIFCNVCPSPHLLRTWLSISDVSIRSKILFKNILMCNILNIKKL